MLEVQAVKPAKNLSQVRRGLPELTQEPQNPACKNLYKTCCRQQDLIQEPPNLDFNSRELRHSLSTSRSIKQSFLNICRHIYLDRFSLRVAK